MILNKYQIFPQTASRICCVYLTFRVLSAKLGLKKFKYLKINFILQWVNLLLKFSSIFSSILRNFRPLRIVPNLVADGATYFNVCLKFIFYLLCVLQPFYAAYYLPSSPRVLLQCPLYFAIYFTKAATQICPVTVLLHMRSLCQPT